MDPRDRLLAVPLLPPTLLKFLQKRVTQTIACATPTFVTPGLSRMKGAERKDRRRIAGGADRDRSHVCATELLHNYPICGVCFSTVKPQTKLCRTVGKIGGGAGVVQQYLPLPAKLPSYIPDLRSFVPQERNDHRPEE